MPDLLTPQALATAGPLVLETFFKHYLFRNPMKHDGQAREDLMYDEAFVLMKTFLEIATKYPVAALQRFGMVRTPTPPWVGLHRVLIRHETLDLAAEYLIKALGGRDMAYKIAGGSKWWQVRAGPGLEGEWIIMKKDWKEYRARERDLKSKEQESLEKLTLAGEDAGLNDKGEFRKEMDELRCMLYIHGGAYYWGSINTHRYTIWRYARKMHGRCFAVNYRKAPQYPFPCAIQDCLAAYLYLVKPPPGAKHKPVDPKNMVIGGDSAGGGLVLALLQILRDTEGLELPAGAVLISPWSDLTHSFPSLLQNTATDIVPPYGFIHKPSSLWPPPPPDLTDEIQSKLRHRVRDAISRAKGGARDRRASVASHLGIRGEPEIERKKEEQDDIASHLVVHQKPIVHHDKNGKFKVTETSDPEHTIDPSGEKEKTMHPMSEGKDGDEHPEPQGEPRIHPSSVNPGLLFKHLRERTPNEPSSNNTTLAQCDIPLRLQVEDGELEINTQCQLYATNAQLCHPWVSPILGYFGGLPPLFVCAGNNEVLRDEIIYLAHKAAHPQDHPIRDDVRAQLPSLQGIEEKYGPTNVHLQVYDGACHDLPLFSMTKPARGLFRAIASFARYVTPSAPGSLSISKSAPASTAVSSTTSIPKVEQPKSSILATKSSKSDTHVLAIGNDTVSATPPSLTPQASQENLNQVSTLQPMTGLTPQKSPAESSTTSESSQQYSVPLPVTAPAPGSGPSGDDAGPRFDDNDSILNDSAAPPGSAGYTGIYRGPNSQPFKDHMIRERVASDGTCRPLESAEKLAAMKMPGDEIGVIKEGAALRYLNGQALWDKKYKHALKTVQRHRRQNLKEARDKDAEKLTTMWKNRVEQHKSKSSQSARTTSTSNTNSTESVDVSDWETDQSSAIRNHVGKGKGKDKTEQGQDGPTEGLDIPDDLLDKSWSWTWALEDEAPPPSAVVSRRDFREARQLALMADRMDSDHSSPVHGLSIWVGLAAFFSNSSERGKAHEALKSAHETKRAEREKRKKGGRTLGEEYSVHGAQGKGDLDGTGDTDSGTGAGTSGQTSSSRDTAGEEGEDPGNKKGRSKFKTKVRQLEYILHLRRRKKEAGTG